MREVAAILNEIEPISLAEMENVKLMDRTDTKYTFSFEELPGILSVAKNNYRVLVVEGKRLSRYETLYYDTSKLSLYNRHHNGELNRYKIRHRTYVESNIGFLEVKFKNNKGRTIKNRIKKKGAPADLDLDSGIFLKSKLPFDPNSLVQVLWVNYSRLTLVSKTSAERLTIDINLEFVKGDKTHRFDGLVIAEVKQESKNPSAFIKLMKALHIREGSISKYCMGVAVTYQNVKKNNFKAKLLTIQKILNNDFITSSR